MLKIFDIISYQQPELSVAQDKITYGEMLISGQVAFLLILILSLNADVAANAQQLPQYLIFQRKINYFFFLEFIIPKESN